MVKLKTKVKLPTKKLKKIANAKTVKGGEKKLRNLIR